MENMDKYTTARIISARAFQIASGAQPNTKAKPEQRIEEVAKQEFAEGKTPLKKLK